MESRRELLLLLGELLEYPGTDLPAGAARCRDLLADVQPEAAGLMADFAAFMESATSSRREELYTAAFDLNPQCSPYVGYQLLGEDPKRTALMVKLQEIYRGAGFSANGELPDHVAVLLRFLAVLEDEDEERDLTSEALLPALNKMAGLLEENRNVYGKVLRAAALLLDEVHTA